MTGQQDIIEFLVQIPGHARCHVDSGFACVKKAYRRSDVETMGELAAVVDGSISANAAVRYPAWCWRNWKSFLGEHFNALPGIRKYQYFRMSSADPGVVMAKTCSDGEETSLCLLKNPGFLFTNTDRPVQLFAPG
ncbi:uncharacterized protein LOC127852442 [Dreissena polymorpha]|uniref:uncharacterized protein LOC127852442 n=1 Tax=Dreissena polymorpha TaxID=45954 RepID=UPI002264E325|nr:uncharacterized protein LOC127852442 [Dreissena polymorpha]